MTSDISMREETCQAPNCTRKIQVFSRPGYRDKRYCSKQCRQDGYKAQRVQRVCVDCGARFSTIDEVTTCSRCR